MQKLIETYLEMGGAAQKTSIADMIVLVNREVDKEAVEAGKVEEGDEDSDFDFESGFFKTLVINS